MFRNRWTYSFWQAIATLAINLITRAIWWSDQELISWNVPIALALGYTIGHVMWPVNQWARRRYEAKLAALHARHVEIMQVVEEARVATDDRHYQEAMAKIEAFLNHPQTGVEVKRPKRREQ